jgi:hypothetical protein
MKIKIVIFIIMIIVGAFSGQYAYKIALASKPPITWIDINFIFVGSIIAMLYVIGLQVLRRKSKYGQWAIYFSSFIVANIISSGLAAVVFAGKITPASVLFLAIGGGSIIGILIAWRFYTYRHLNKAGQIEG